ncbi:uncharacterized protein [Physcomitrium patens]|uniref:uncharacterized protein isoform X3 n=1 Tax=Physcomitrium patens TaxID=3218 RepID=UPI000D15FA65|nr:putative dual specificity tyrosine-phosphorylation-regulated kinase 3 homolog isoform X2 [Physcomitrium patens]|eukprot:XP_024378125.1 putative dual specificity tyrosine-phosphorylation-regulated kinase 3 homolog isoform X2 [Physcomitrella patens]
MGRQDSASGAESKLLHYTALLNHDLSQRPRGSRKILYSKAISGVSKMFGTLRAMERPRRIDTARAELPILNLAKVRHNLTDEAELATGFNGDDSFFDQKLEDIPLNEAGASSSVSAEPSGIQDRAKGTNATQRSPKTGLYIDERAQSISKLSQAANREKTLSTKQTTSTSHPFFPALYFPYTPSQTRRRANLKGSTLHSLSKGGSLSNRGMTAPGNSESGLTMREVTERERMQMEEKKKMKLKTSRPLPEDISAESEACHRPKRGSNLVRPVKSQKAIGAKVGLKEGTDRRPTRKHLALQRGADEVQGEDGSLDSATHKQPTCLSALVQQSSKAIKPPKLNIASCQTTVPLGFGGNPIDSAQTSRSSVERQAAAEASPRLVITERGTSRKSMLTSLIQSRDHKYDTAMPALGSPGIGSSPEMVLRQCGQHLNEFEQREILPYSQIYYLGLESDKIQPSTTLGTCNFGYDDERGDYNVVNHDQLAYRYEVLGTLGKGSFGQVLKCSDHKYKVLRAIKMIRNKRRFHQQALTEVKILEHLRDKAKEESSSTNIVTIYESFYFRSHLCITFSLHDISLYELIKRNNFQGINLVVIKSFASQLLQTLRYLRKLNVIHCDLKPENILLQHPAMSKIKVIDFGSSCFSHEKVYTYIQSRFYRSPEVILGLPYDTKVDIWSFGCILAELFSGYPLFPGENEVEQLACMMEVLGLPSSAVLENATRKKMFFDSNNCPRIVSNSWGKKHWPGTKDLATAIMCKDLMFVDFLESCLRWDKDARMTPDELMQHSWMIGPTSQVTPQRSPLRPSNLDSSKRRSIKSSGREDVPQRSHKQSKPSWSSSHLSTISTKPQSSGGEASSKANQGVGNLPAALPSTSSGGGSQGKKKPQDLNLFLPFEKLWDPASPPSSHDSPHESSPSHPRASPLNPITARKSAATL